MVNFTPQSKESITLSSPQVEPTVARFASERHPPYIYAGTTQGLYVFDPEQRLEWEGNSITAIANAGTELWAILDRRSMWHRPLNGEWFPVGSGYNRRLSCLLPMDETILIGTSEAHLMQIKDGTLQPLASFEQAEGRESWYTPWGGAPEVRSLAMSSSGVLYVNVHVGGILRSQDQGQSWQPTLDLHADVHQVITFAEIPNLVLAATAEGLAWSEDCGETWQFDHTYLHATYARAISATRNSEGTAICSHKDEATILMSVSLGPQGGKSALYRRSLNQPGSFEKCQQGLPEWFADNINTSCLATWGNWAVFGTQTGKIFRSDNAGLTWEPIASGLAPIQCLSFVSTME